jgi:hypothetical protein
MSEIKADLMERTVEFIKGLESVSAVNLQRQFRINYVTASFVMDELITRKHIRAARDEMGRHVVIKKKGQY